MQVGGLLTVAAIGVPHLGDHSLTAGFSTAGLMTAAALVFFAFVGFDEVITLAEETTDPVRTVPRALLLALGISTLLYVGVAIAGVSVLGAAALGASDQPLADVVAVAVGSSSGYAVAVVALVATTNTTLLAITAASRLQFGMASTGALPATWSRLNGRRAPWVGIVAAVGVAAAFVSLGDLALVASVTDFAIYVVFIAVNVTVILLRFWQPKRRRPFAIRGTIGKVPVTPVLALGTIGLLMPSLRFAALLLGAAVMAAGLAAYAVLGRTAPAGHQFLTSPPEGVMPPRTKISSVEAAQVAATLRVDFAAVDFDLDQFRRGLTVELEHGAGDPDTNVTNDDLVATGKIALAHLNQFPDYYTRLAAMEADARREWS